ncbi:LytR C-terminal domain-containing protein [Actinotalea sp. M2MS4P-6]|uniref:LytR C-terminal domain-containing protein n=1 Tax=Actinotalea sp. M2MS4P-6 TaxID=2983762 RepID=UPI0021E50E6F|nr:LytR C-terminal domain-containing protein [Actinotalea sp. M2MS4P-6]MCV2393067.1 LytR C-terminal domain-containing protein [Actinotalea sp. M2MS4P-6]
MATDKNRARQLRRRHQHERQAVVFGGLVAGLAVVALAAAAVFTNAIDVPFLAKPFATPTTAAPTGTVLPDPPCPEEGALPLDYAAVNITVLNGSDRAGLAGITGDDLAARGFTVVSTGNYDTIDVAAELRFGASGISAAYTLAAQMATPALVLDTREDASVDLVLGADFAGLIDATEVDLDPTVALVGVAGCVPADQLTPVPGPTPTATEEPTDDATDGATDAPAEGDQTDG